jgi:hypothetical protein
MKALSLFRKREPSCFGRFDRGVGEEGPGSAVLAISKEFGKSVDWLLTGQTEK